MDGLFTRIISRKKKKYYFVSLFIMACTGLSRVLPNYKFISSTRSRRRLFRRFSEFGYFNDMLMNWDFPLISEVYRSKAIKLFKKNLSLKRHRRLVPRRRKDVMRSVGFMFDNLKKIGRFGFFGYRNFHVNKFRFNRLNWSVFASHDRFLSRPNLAFRGLYSNFINGLKAEIESFSFSNYRKIRLKPRRTANSFLRMRTKGLQFNTKLSAIKNLDSFFLLNRFGRRFRSTRRSVAAHLRLFCRFVAPALLTYRLKTRRALSFGVLTGNTPREKNKTFFKSHSGLARFTSIKLYRRRIQVISSMLAEIIKILRKSALLNFTLVGTHYRRYGKFLSKEIAKGRTKIYKDPNRFIIQTNSDLLLFSHNGCLKRLEKSKRRLRRKFKKLRR